MWIRFLCFTLFILFLDVLLGGCAEPDESRTAHFRAGGAFVSGGPSLSADGKHLVFASPRTGNGDIYQVELDGTGRRQLTSDAKLECDPSYSPDGKKIVFVRENSKRAELWIMNSDGTGQSPLSSSDGDLGNPKYASNGEQIVLWKVDPTLRKRFDSAHSREIYSLNLITGVETRLTQNNVEDVFPCVSPDRKMIAVTRDDRIWLISETAAPSRLLCDGVHPSFSRDGKQIVLVGGRYGRQIDVIDIDGSNRRTIYSKNTTVSHPLFGPMQSTILFLEEAHGDGIGDIIETNLAGTLIRRITSTR